MILGGGFDGLAERIVSVVGSPSYAPVRKDPLYLTSGVFDQRSCHRAVRRGIIGQHMCPYFAGRRVHRNVELSPGPAGFAVLLTCPFAPLPAGSYTV